MANERPPGDIVDDLRESLDDLYGALYFEEPACVTEHAERIIRLATEARTLYGSPEVKP